MAIQVPQTLAQRAGMKILQHLEREEAKDFLAWVDGHMPIFAHLLWEKAPLVFDPQGTVLYGYVDPASAYVVENYPYGRDRTLMRYWLEYKKSRGYRFVSQTLNPKSKIWNKAHPGIYSQSLVMVQRNDNGHIEPVSPVGWSTADTIEKLRHYGQGYNRDTLGEILASAVTGVQHYLSVLNYQKKTGLSGITINGVPVPVRPGDIERTREHYFENALILALFKGDRGLIGGQTST